MLSFAPQLFAQQATRTGDATSQVVLWAGLLIVILIGGAVLVLLLRRTLFAKDSGASAASGLMDGLRKLRDEGKMSEEEYQAARRAMTTRVRASMDAASASPKNGDTRSKNTKQNNNVPPGNS